MENYFEILAINNTSLGWFLEDPRIFNQKFYNFKEEVATYSQKMGSAVHCKLLEPDKFSDKYITYTGSIPSDTICTILEACAVRNPHILIDEIVLEEARKVNYGKQWKDATIIEKIKVYLDYYKFKASAKTKIILSEEELASVEAATTTILSDSYSSSYFNQNVFAVEQYNERAFLVTDEITKLPLKAKIDRFYIENGKLTIVDIKTTSKRGDRFIESIQDYGYARQLAFYSKILAAAFNITQIDAVIIAVSLGSVSTATVYKMSESTMLKERERIDQTLFQIKECMETDSWYPVDYSQDKGIWF